VRSLNRRFNITVIVSCLVLWTYVLYYIQWLSFSPCSSTAGCRSGIITHGGKSIKKGKKTRLQLFQVHHLSPPGPRAPCTNTIGYEKWILSSWKSPLCHLHFKITTYQSASCAQPGTTLPVPSSHLTLSFIMEVVNEWQINGRKSSPRCVICSLVRPSSAKGREVTRAAGK